MIIAWYYASRRVSVSDRVRNAQSFGQSTIDWRRPWLTRGALNLGAVDADSFWWVVWRSFSAVRAACWAWPFCRRWPTWKNAKARNSTVSTTQFDGRLRPLRPHLGRRNDVGGRLCQRCMIDEFPSIRYLRPCALRAIFALLRDALPFESRRGFCASATAARPTTTSIPTQTMSASAAMSESYPRCAINIAATPSR